MPKGGKKVALIHYWLIGMGGGEKVLEAFCEIFPDADIFTHVYDPQKVSKKITSHPIKTSFINNLPFSKKIYKHYLPLMPLALEQLDLSDYDLVISFESGPTKGVICSCEHICYCHTPMRYLWDLYHEYVKGFNPIVRTIVKGCFYHLRMWDVISSLRPDSIIANSNAVSNRVKKNWRRDASVIHPPVETDFFNKYISEEDDGYYLFVGRLVAYKRADLAIKACLSSKRKLIIVGAGPEKQKLQKIASDQVEFYEDISAEELAAFYSKCKALLFPGEEDFGIVPIEAMSCGKPVIAYKKGGALDYINNKTGLFFDDPTQESLVEAIFDFEKKDSYDAWEIVKFAQNFSVKNFDYKIRKYISEKTSFYEK